MPLFCDGDISTISDLTDQDSALLDTVANENIDLTQKLRLAQSEVRVELESYMERSKTNYWYSTTASGLDVQHVVVTLPLKMWHTYRTLSAVYRDAYCSQLNDRYQGKWRLFESMAGTALSRLLEAGVGLVNDPVPQATAPLLSMVPGVQPGGEFYAAVSYVNRAGEEGMPSSMADITLADGTDLTVVPQSIPDNATGWNLYVGSQPTQLTLQNPTPMPDFQPLVWLLRVTDGRPAGCGQVPNRLRPLPRRWQRG